MDISTSKTATQKNKTVNAILAFQPLFAVPIYFSVLVNAPPLWLSLAIAIIPLGLRFWCTHHIIPKTPFDLPILIFVLGMFVGLAVAPDKEVALGGLATTLASALIYYGIVSNSEAENKYWLWIAGTTCVITLLIAIWFFSQGDGRQFFFNQWAFNLFKGLPQNGSPPLSWNSVAALLVTVLPPLFSVALFKGNKSLRIVGLIFGLIFLGILFLTVSGGGWIAVMCGLAFVLICWRLLTTWIIVPALGFITLIIIIFHDKVLWLAQAFAWDSLHYRLVEWSNTLHLINGSSIFTGLGPGNWVDIYNNHYNMEDIIIHNSYLQLYTDAGILGMIALIIAVVFFVRASTNILSSSRQNPWYGVGVGIIGGIIAGGVFACYDVTITGTIVTATGYIYLSIPLLWVLVALLVVSKKHLSLSPI
jgi:O-antigen ligase